MSKSSHFTGQPIYSQLLSLLDKRQIMRLSQEHSGERYTKRFDAWTHLVVMLYAVIKCFDSLREIAVSLLAEAPKLQTSASLQWAIGVPFLMLTSTVQELFT